MPADRESKQPPIVLTIAGSDSSGGAGIQADLKTIAAFDCFGMSVLTAITAQNSQGIDLVHGLPSEVVRAQLKSILDDYPIAVIKIGMVGTKDIVQVLTDQLSLLKNVPIILDTPLVSTTQSPLAQEGVVEAMLEHLFPLAKLVTPNLDEAGVFLNKELATSVDEMMSQAKELKQFGSGAVLLKGGHLPGFEEGQRALDVFYDGMALETLTAPWVKVSHTHGTGCVLASAIAAKIAKNEVLGRGKPLVKMVNDAKIWLAECLALSSDMGLGMGSGPVKISKLPKFTD